MWQNINNWPIELNGICYFLMLFLQPSCRFDLFQNKTLAARKKNCHDFHSGYKCQAFGCFPEWNLLTL